MAVHNLPFFEARSLVMKKEKNSKQVAQGVPTMSLKNFPALPQKMGITLADIPAKFQGSSKNGASPALNRECDPILAARLTAVLEKILGM